MFVGLALGLALPPGVPTGPGLPALTVSGGQITPFTRDGVDYVEVLFQQSGSFTLAGPVEGAKWALAAGGAAGGPIGSQGTQFRAGGGGAGGLLVAEGALEPGSYAVNIGAGAPSNAAENGSDSIWTRPAGALTVRGGGNGAWANVGNTEGKAGGSGGGGRGNIAGSSSGGAALVAGQGFRGGNGYINPNAPNASGAGGGGSAAAGADGDFNLGGAGGNGRLLDWIANPRRICAGGGGVGATAGAGGLGGGTGAVINGNSENATWGSGSGGVSGGSSGSGGNGFLFLVVRADQARVVAA